MDFTRSQSCQKAHVVEIEKECMRIRAQVRQRTKFLYRQHGEVQVNAVKVRSPIISPLKCAHIFEEQQLSRRGSLRHQRGKECHICLAGAVLHSMT